MSSQAQLNGAIQISLGQLDSPAAEQSPNYSITQLEPPQKRVRERPGDNGRAAAGLTAITEITVIVSILGDTIELAG